LVLGLPKHHSCVERLAVPARNEGRDHGLVSAGRDAEEVNNSNLVIECFAQPSIVCGLGVLTHEGIVNRFVAFKNLAMYLALVVVPDLATRPGEYCLDRENKSHLLRLKDATPRDPLALEQESRL
jgi:hypothetical protein